MYLIYKGQMKIFFNSIDGEEQIFYIYTDGDFVGGLNLLVDEPYRYIGQALTDCKVVAIRGTSSTGTSTTHRWCSAASWSRALKGFAGRKNSFEAFHQQRIYEDRRTPS